MELSQQVCSLEQAKKLKEMEVAQASCFSYYGDAQVPYKVDYSPASETSHNYEPNEIYSAYTAAELGLMLPTRYIVVRQFNGDNAWWCQRIWDNDTLEDLFAAHPENGKSGYSSEAEARAALLIYLLETKEAALHDVNWSLATPQP